MSSIAVIAFTRKGCALGRSVSQKLADGASVVMYGPARMALDEGVIGFDELSSWARDRFAADDALVFIGATGIAVRAIAPFVQDKLADPAVVAIDEAGSFVVPLLSGHVGGANELARMLADAIGAQAVVSTATDVNEVFAVDEWAARQGFEIVERDVAREISAALLEGQTVGFAADGAFDWQLPEGVVEGEAALGFVVSLDETFGPFGRTLHLVPRTVTVGVGCRKGADPRKLEAAVADALAQAGVSPRAVATLASIDVKSDELAIVELARKRGWNLCFYSAEELAAVPGEFASSEFVERTVGVGNVCERAACAQGAQLLAGKRANDGTTVAIACEPFSLAASPSQAAVGKLSVVGLGPGGADDMTARARKAIERSSVIAGYSVYVDLIRNEFPGKEILSTPMRKEVERCRIALERADQGDAVALVCSGDPGVYGMAGLVFELAREWPDVEIEVVAGVSAANGGAAVLGAPLMHDYCVISLSDLLTPWEDIERRLMAAAESDFVIALYNPSSHKRPDHLRRACDVLLSCKSPSTVCATVRNIGRDEEESRVMTLGELRDTPVDMFTTVFVGNGKTQRIGDRMVTPRGYLQRGGR